MMRCRGTAGLSCVRAIPTQTRKLDRINEIIRQTAAARGLPHFTGQLMSISAGVNEVDRGFAHEVSRFRVLGLKRRRISGIRP